MSTMKAKGVLGWLVFLDLFLAPASVLLAQAKPEPLDSVEVSDLVRRAVVNFQARRPLVYD